MRMLLNYSYKTTTLLKLTNNFQLPTKNCLLLTTHYFPHSALADGLTDKSSNLPAKN